MQVTSTAVEAEPAKDEEEAVRAAIQSLSSASRSSMLELGADLLQSFADEPARKLSAGVEELMLVLENLLRGVIIFSDL